MAVPVTITDLSVTIASNSPAGTDNIAAATGPDDYLRALAGIVRREQAQGANVASAATVDLGAIADGNYVHITGTTTITAFGTVAAGISRTLVFDGALTLTHNATSLILPGAANITTVAGDVGVFRSEGSGNWRCVTYTFSEQDDYDEYTAASAACTGAITTAAIWKLTKIGNHVTLTLPQVIGAGVATTSFTFGTAIPAKYRPAATVSCMAAQITNNGSSQSAPGLIQVTAAGDINVFRDGVASSFTVTANAGLTQATSVSWVI